MTVALMAVERNIPVALTIAGSDSSAGAGIQADLKTFAALDVYGVSAVTCIVAETPGKVSCIERVSPEMVREQIEVLAKNFPIAAIKTGLLCSAEIVAAVARAIVDLVRQRTDSPGRARHIPLVIDPVFIATTGQQLLSSEAIGIYEKELFPLATLITPNLDEAGKLLGEQIQDRASMKSAAEALGKKYGLAILLKGGHLGGDDAIDLLYTDVKITEFTAPFIRDMATHGTGCTYSAAIAGGLAAGLSLEAAIRRAKKFITASITQHFRWTSQSGENIDALNHSASTGNA
jgi:hydroxymethylpyrimidine/phosphomethylpyrimidine kinase